MPGPTLGEPPAAPPGGGCKERGTRHGVHVPFFSAVPPESGLWDPLEVAGDG